MQTFNGPDTATLRYQNLNGHQVQVKVEEERSANAETQHANEVVGYMALWPAAFAGSNGDDNLQLAEEGTVQYGTINNLNHVPKTVTLDHPFVNPVVILGVLSYNGGHTSTVRVQNVQPQSFEVFIKEWDYHDGPHTTETLSWMVVEAGHHVLPNGMEYDAAQFCIGDSSPTRVTLFEGFEDDVTPVVFTQVTTSAGDHAIEARHFDVASDSFMVVMQNEQAQGEFQTREQGEVVHYIAIAPRKTERSQARVE